MTFLLAWIIALFYPLTLHPATCTSISRTNAAANAILTSSTYNADLNTVYTHTNALDLGCGTDATLEASALDTTAATGFAVPLNAVHQGCLVTRASASQLQVDQCYLSVNNNWVVTTSQTNVSFGCSGCAGETASTVFYVYALTTSDGAALNLSIQTTVPDNDGFDASGNRVLAKFFNNGSSDIVANRISNWIENKFDDRQVYSAKIINNGTATIDLQNVAFIASATRVATGVVNVSWVTDFFTANPIVTSSGQTTGGDGEAASVSNPNKVGVVVQTDDTGGGTNIDSDFYINVIRSSADAW